MNGAPDVPPLEAKRVLLIVPPRQIAYFHAIIEGYDDLAVIRTLSAEEGLVEVYISPGAEGEFDGLLRALRTEGLPLREADDGGVERSR